MPRFCANLTVLFTELPLTDRILAARDVGFDAVEILWPQLDTDDLTGLRQVLDDTGLELALINSPRGDAWGSAALSGTRFDTDLHQALEVARVLRPGFIHIMAGKTVGVAAKDIYVANLKRACDLAPDQMFTIEPISPATLPGYFMNDFDLAAGVLADVGRRNLHLQFDAYHAHMITGDLMGTWAKFAPLAAHIQIAGAPGRHEPDRGEIDFPAFFARLDNDGYTGVVSAEYTPAARTEDGLDWLRLARS